MTNTENTENTTMVWLGNTRIGRVRQIDAGWVAEIRVARTGDEHLRFDENVYASALDAANVLTECCLRSSLDEAERFGAWETSKGFQTDIAWDWYINPQADRDRALAV